MKNTHAWRTINNLIPMLFFLGFCLLLLFVNPLIWLLGEPLFAEHCGLTIENQAGKTLCVTPINNDGNSYSAVRLYRTTYPIFPAHQQRNIEVKYGEQVSLSFDCDTRVSELYVCDIEGECYLYRSPYEKATLKSLEGLSRPNAALEAAVQSFPEHNYGSITNVLLCLVQIIALVGELYWLIRTRTNEIPQQDI